MWGTTLPARLASLQTPEDAGLAEGKKNLNSFLSDAEGNLAEVIGAGAGLTPGDSSNPFNSALPAGNAYIPGAPAQEQPGYYDSPLQEQPSLEPVARREVRLGTSTASAPADRQ